MDAVLDVAAELAQELGCRQVKQEIVEAILDDVLVDDLRYTQRSISSCFGFGASLEDLVRWLDERGKRGGGGCDAPFDLNEWRANGRLQVVRRANGALESNDNRRLWCLKEHQRSQPHPVRTRVWIFPLPSVFETFVRHRNVSPAREIIRRRGSRPLRALPPRHLLFAGHRLTGVPAVAVAAATVRAPVLVHRPGLLTGPELLCLGGGDHDAPGG
jgi:hypothetical protein